MVKQFLFVFLVLSATRFAFAEEFVAKGRIFAGANSADPAELNTEMSKQNIKDFKTLTKYGVDITYALSGVLDVGFRYERISQKNLEVTATAGQDFSANLTQDAVLGVARTTYLKSDILRGDVFVGAGAASTKFAIKNATQDGQLESSGYNSLVAEAGTSVGVGYKKVFVFLEGGYIYNKVSSGLGRTGNINGNVGTLDLSGGYLVLGLLFDDIMARK
jgi:hypothetical protein